jgi:hypothetical protein
MVVAHHEPGRRSIEERADVEGDEQRGLARDERLPQSIQLRREHSRIHAAIAQVRHRNVWRSLEPGDVAALVDFDPDGMRPAPSSAASQT